MQSASEYLDKTDSAVRHLFYGVESYLKLLRTVVSPVFVTSELFGPVQQAEFEAWQMENAESLTAAREAEKEFIAEYFALGTLAGSLLQVAAKGLEMYGKGVLIPTEWKSFKSLKAQFCCGRIVRGIPLGLVVHAARNQHAHYNEPALSDFNTAVFDRLATGHGWLTSMRDPAFDLSTPGLTTLSTNVTGLIEWRSHEQYLIDMRDMLGL